MLEVLHSCVCSISPSKDIHIVSLLAYDAFHLIHISRTNWCRQRRIQMCFAQGFFILLFTSPTSARLCGLWTDVYQTGHLKLICPLRFNQQCTMLNWWCLFRSALLLKLFFKLMCNLAWDYSCKNHRVIRPPTAPLTQRGDERLKSH